MLEIWLTSFLASLIGTTYLALWLPPGFEWVLWPVTISLISAIFAAVVLEIAVRFMYTPEIASFPGRALMFCVAVIIGVILDYAIIPEPITPRGFRIVVFLLFGGPLFGWLFGHLGRHLRASNEGETRLQQVVLAAFATLTFLLFVAATFRGGAA